MADRGREPGPVDGPDRGHLHLAVPVVLHHGLVDRRLPLPSVVVRSPHSLVPPAIHKNGKNAHAMTRHIQHTHHNTTLQRALRQQPFVLGLLAVRRLEPARHQAVRGQRRRVRRWRRRELLPLNEAEARSNQTLNE